MINQIRKRIKTEPIILFEKGMNNCENYRIPSIITTSKGTVIAAIDARVDEPGDNPNNIDKVIRVSKDSGENWSEPMTIVDYPGKGRYNGSAAIDAAMVEDEETHTIFMIFSHTPAGVGLWNSEQGIGFDELGRKKLYGERGEKYLLCSHGKVVNENGKTTCFKVDEYGNVLKNGLKISNIYLNQGELLESRTSFLQMIKSEDEGNTWTKPVELNFHVKEEWMRFIGAGPGVGIQIKHGKYKGRLLFPIYYSNDTNKKMSCSLIYSDDHGATWKRGKSPNDGRKYKNTIYNSKELNETQLELTECQVVENKDGKLKLFMRNHNNIKRTAYAISEDGGESFGEVSYDENLLDPTCQSSIIMHFDDEGKEVFLFSNPSHEKERINGTVKLSEDYGESWGYSKLIKSDSYLYSCLTVLPDNNIGLIYEAVENDDNKVYFTKFNVNWVKNI